jgi:hypothetical protein
MPERRLLSGFLLLALSVVSTPARAQSAGAPPAPKLHRWIDWQSGALDARYRAVENSAGQVTTNQLQTRQTAKLGVLLDRARRYSVQLFAGTGSNFTGSWDPLGPGTGDPTWDPNVRQLYFSAAPVRGMVFDAGGFGLVRGEATEITSYDNDGFLTGVRATLRRPRELLLDEISITGGFLGDLTTPNVFRRLDRLDDHNYTQVLAAKRVHATISLSGDWTSVEGVSTFREAARATTRAWIPLDFIRIELYQRVEGPKGNGFAVWGERALTGRVAVNGGYADIDRVNGTLNSDRFGIGRRLFTEGRVAVLPTLTVSVFFGAALDNAFAVANHRRFDLVASWNVLKALQRAGLW